MGEELEDEWGGDLGAGFSDSESAVWRPCCLT